MFSRVLLVVVGAGAGVMFFWAGAALAYLATSDSSHPAQAAAATLAAPTAGSQNGTATPSSVPIQWNAPNGYTPTGYTVLRCAGTSCTNFTAITNGTCGGTVGGTGCTDTDTALAAGTTYNYEVEAQFHNWVSTPGSSFNGTTSTLTSLTFTTQPSAGANIQAKGTGSFSVSVAIEDAHGNVATHDSTDTVTLAIGHNAGPGGVLSCTNSGGLTVTASAGVANFTGCAITKGGPGYTLTASSASNTSLTAPANAHSFNITAGTAAKLAFTAQPSSGQNIQAKGTGSFGVSVAIQDSNGNTVTGSTDSVTVAIGNNAGPGGVLSCTDSGGLTVTASAGVANFTGCAITKAGSGYTVTATDTTNTSLAALTSNSFNITAGNPSQVIATSGAGQSATADAAFANPLVATVEDVDGNPVSGVPVTFAAPSSSASVTFASCASNPHAYSCVANTGSNGQATSSAFTANATLGTYNISASATGAGSVNFSESNAATAITSLVTANGGGGTAGELNAGDTITLTFSAQINANNVCSAWTNGSSGTPESTGSVVTVSNTGTGNNILSFTTAPSACTTFNFGSIDLGSNQYVTSPGGSNKSATFTNSTISYNGTTHTLVITLGTVGGQGAEGVVSASALTLSLSPSILDTAGNSLSSYSFTTTSGKQF